MTLGAEEVKSCCSAAYASDLARFLLGDSFHPGGATLTARLVEALGVGPDDSVVDVASGRGASALQLARATGCAVVGVDLSADNVAAAAQAAEEAGLAGRVRFLVGDAEALPLPRASADGALCECALCTFPDKRAAVRELARVLRPGAPLALSDVTAAPERLPPELTTQAASIACVGDARPLEEIVELLAQTELVVERTERHDDALGELLERLEARLRAARLVFGGAVERGRELAAAAGAALEDGALGYGVVIARRA